MSQERLLLRLPCGSAHPAFGSFACRLVAPERRWASRRRRSLRHGELYRLSRHGERRSHVCALPREVTVRSFVKIQVARGPAAEKPARSRAPHVGGRRTWGLVASTLGLLLWVASCSEPTPVEEQPIRAHPPEWSDPAKSDWHGTRVALDGVISCTGCHGEDLRGDLVVPGCDACHDGPGGHPATWVKQPEPFHGTKVQMEGPMVCTACHGDDYRGGWSGVSCSTCHDGPGGHPQGWLDSNAHTFHGRVVTMQGNLDCRRCHGNDLLGGTSGVSCGDCHFD